ncbi:MAG: hypothetical protein ABIN91_17490 [Mucilaginibacter sp.]
MIFLAFVLIIIHCLSTSISIVLLGDKKLISNNLFKPANVLLLIINWKFILSMSLAVISRISFVLINNTLLKIPYLAGTATTITVFVTMLSIVFILLANHFFLNETLNLKQSFGALVILTGVFIIISK